MAPPSALGAGTALCVVGAACTLASDAAAHNIDLVVHVTCIALFCLAIDHPVWRRDAELLAEEQRAAQENDGGAAAARAGGVARGRRRE